MKLLNLVIALSSWLKVLVVVLILIKVLKAYPVLKFYELGAEKLSLVNDRKLEHEVLEVLRHGNDDVLLAHRDVVEKTK